MFYIALFFLILLGILTLDVIAQNVDTLTSPLHLTVLVWHLPGIPVLLFCLLAVFLGALMLYVLAARSARHDRLEMKMLHARIEDLERGLARAPSGGLVNNFAPSVVPIPGFAPGGPTGPIGGPPPLTQSGPPPILPGPPLNPPGPPPGLPGPANSRQPPPNSLQNISPSASGNNLSLPPRLFQPSPQQQQQTGGQRPPFPHP